jgi:hypothetical protein
MLWQTQQGPQRLGKALGVALFPLPVGLARVYLARIIHRPDE